MPLTPVVSTGVFSAFRYPVMTSSGLGYTGVAANTSVTPGAVNTPIIFEPPPGLSGGQLLLWIIATGGANWGGCEVYASPDNTTYLPIGFIYAGQVQGVLTGTFASGSDPDTSNTLAVDLTESGETLIAGTTGDADDYLSLCIVDSELVAYSAATLTAANKYSLGTYIRRGAWGTTIASHSIGASFARIVSSTFSQIYPSNLIGKTLYFKLASFNLSGGQQQSLSACTAYPYTLTGAGLLPLVYRVTSGTSFTIPSNPIAAPDIQVIWASSTAGAKTTTVPGAGTTDPRFRLGIATSLGNGDQHTITPTSGTIQGASSYSFVDTPGGANISLLADAAGTNLIIT